MDNFQEQEIITELLNNIEDRKSFNRSIDNLVDEPEIQNFDSRNLAVIKPKDSKIPN